MGNCLQNCVRDLRIKIANGEQLKATDAFQPGLGFGQRDIEGVLDASPSDGGMLLQISFVLHFLETMVNVLERFETKHEIHVITKGGQFVLDYFGLAAHIY